MKRWNSEVTLKQHNASAEDKFMHLSSIIT